MSYRYVLPLLITITFSIGNTISAENPLKLSDSDFIVAGVYPGMPSENIKAKLGEANNISIYDDYREPTLKYSVWEYNGLNITVETGKIINGITILNKAFSTKRGLTVGSSKKKLIKLYGTPTGTYNDDWDYNYLDDLTVIRVTLNNNKVASIYLGGISD